jgi:hypothetical protein
MKALEADFQFASETNKLSAPFADTASVLIIGADSSFESCDFEVCAGKLCRNIAFCSTSAIFVAGGEP